jgi:hypothetical protein
MFVFVCVQEKQSKKQKKRGQMHEISGKMANFCPHEYCTKQNASLIGKYNNKSECDQNNQRFENYLVH